MKKLFASLACAALLITALTGCGQKTGSTRTPEELTQLYQPGHHRERGRRWWNITPSLPRSTTRMRSMV